jgi:EAL and modified HD-GYP domain-containing signal transduction protein
LEADTQAETKQLAEQTLAIARQPIYNDQMGVFGYELLFRPSPRNTQPLNSASATAHVLTSALLSTGLEQIVYNRKAIINVTRAFIDVMLQVQLPPEKIMLDLPDNIRVDEVLMDNLRELKGAGYELSIGGFHCLRETRLLAIADNFRVDEKKLDAEQLDRLTKFLRR